jgi:hypothetical protein
MKKAKTKRDDSTHCRKIKLFSITMPNFCSRKGIYQMRIFVYKIVKVSKCEAITHTTLHDFWTQFSRWTSIRLTYIQNCADCREAAISFVLRVKRICHPRRYKRVEALTSFQRNSLTSACSARYRSSPPHTSAPAHVICSCTTSSL